MLETQKADSLDSQCVSGTHHLLDSVTDIQYYSLLFF